MTGQRRDGAGGTGDADGGAYPGRIRAAQVSDAPLAAAIHLETAIHAYGGIFPSDAPPPSIDELVDLWERRLAAVDDDPRARSQVLLAETRAGAGGAGGASGAVGVVSFVPEPPGDARLLGFYVRPTAWGQGHGHALHDAVLARLSGHAAALHAWVLEGNARGLAWYRRHGYHPTGQRLAILPDHGIYDEGWRLPLP